MKFVEIFFDTCIIKSSNNYSEVNFGSNYSDFVDFLGSNDLIDKCKLNVCRIVLREYSKQIIESFSKDKETLKKFRSINDDSIKIENDFISNIDVKIDEYIKNENLHIIEIPMSSKSYSKIIDRAINKEKPFCGDKGRSDKGFKDAIQWESILEYAKHCDSEEYILLTENKNDFNEYLEKEFNRDTNKNIRIFNVVGESQKYILELNEVVSKYDTVKSILEDMLDNELIQSFTKDLCIERDYTIDEIESIGNIVDLGNNLYSFDIYIDNEHQVFYRVDCELMGTDLIAKDIIICL